MQLERPSPVGRTSSLDLCVLGPMRAIRAGRDLPLGGPKQRSVLAVLLLEAGRVVPSERLVDELWRGRPPPGAVKTLRSYVSRLRTLLRPDAALIARGGGYVLELEQAQVDAARFELLVGEGQAALARGAARVAADRLRDGLALWRGRALADLVDIESLALESRRLEELRLTALEGRIEAELDLGLHNQLVGELETLVAEHPLRERFWRQLVLALYRCERQADALAAYRRARELLAGELGLEPSEELRRLEQAVLRQDVPPVARRTQRHNLPSQLTSFVGREQELAELEQLLPEARLLTLTGVGGVGKTRLALELAARVEGFPGGVWLVDLSGIANTALIPQQVAQVLGLRESPNLPLVEILCNHLRKTDVLLLLDNCEHLLPTCAELVETLLQGAPTLRILATSREAVGVAGEVEYALMPLAVPTTTTDPKETTAVAAVRLFLERSSATHSVAPTPIALATVARICRDLDGIPLAIELAAARTRTLSVDEIAAHLDDRFGFLTYWRRVAVPRHQTLKATMDWSYELLSEAEREVLCRLSVFAGGFTLRAAAAVCVGGDEATPLDLVGRLVERSLVVGDHRDGETRYRLLETVRQYAAERLAEAGKVDETRRAHALAFLSLAEEGAPTGESLGRLALEQDNLRAALDWSLSAGEEIGPRLALAVSPFWFVREQDEEGRRWLERALEAHPERDGLRAELLGLLGTFMYEAGDLRRAGAFLSEGLTLAQAESNRALEARLRVRNAVVRLHLRDVGWTEVLRECERAAVVLEADGDLSGLADAWVAIGKARSWVGDDSNQEAFERAASYARRSGNRRAELVALEFLALSFLDLRVPTDVAIEQEEELLVAAAGDRYTEEAILGPLAWLYGFAGRFTEARQAIARNRALYAERGASVWWAGGAQIAGSIELLAGDPVAAEGVLRETYEALHAMGEVSYLSTTALWLAESLYEQGRFKEAEELTDEAETSAHPDDFIDQVQLRTIRAKLHARRGDVGAAKRLVDEARRITPAGKAQLLGDVLLTNAEVLRGAGHSQQAASALRAALRLYEERRVVPLADRARTLLEELAADSLAQPR
jgi:predicted ATPase/DNA-binding SARP family transcriptional activator/tetratricopeptide (TPR) repeat protein